MSWLALVIIGVIVFACSFFPLPHPMPRVLQVLGGILVVVGIILLLFGLVGTSAHTDVDVDGMRALLRL